MEKYIFEAGRQEWAACNHLAKAQLILQRKRPVRTCRQREFFPFLSWVSFFISLHPRTPAPYTLCDHPHLPWLF